jgi:adenosylcobyric acid synthase
LQWLKENKLDQAIINAYKKGAVIIGICGGYQILGKTLSDPLGVAGSAGIVTGLGILPIHTNFSSSKTVTQVELSYKSDRWYGYEIHMGETVFAKDLDLLPLDQSQKIFISHRKTIGTYIHGLFESIEIRKTIASLANIKDYKTPAKSWQQEQQQLYDQMADFISDNLDLAPILNYLDTRRS